jgi:AhpD family alkylhydroperoxidase
MKDPLAFFTEVYGSVPDWAQMMHDYAPAALVQYTQLRDQILVEGALAKKDKELILVGINAARRYERTMLLHTKGALDAGASIEELASLLTTCIISRGIPSWIVGMEAIKYAITYVGQQASPNGPTEEQHEPLPQTAEDCLAYYTSDSGAVPDWVQQLYQTNPEVLVQYCQLRTVALSSGAVSRKLKELLLIGINAAERYPEGIRIHVAGARKHGASNQEIAEVALVAVLTAGIPAWIEVSEWIK